MDKEKLYNENRLKEKVDAIIGKLEQNEREKIKVFNKKLKEKILDYYHNRANASEKESFKELIMKMVYANDENLYEILQYSVYILEDGEVAGFLLLSKEMDIDDNEVFIVKNIFVFPEYRGNGLKEEMLKRGRKFIEMEMKLKKYK